VARLSDGTIQVTIRELSNPAGLQRQLRADGVPASVTLIGQQNPSCRPYRASRALLDSVITRTFAIRPAAHHGPPTDLQLDTTFTLLPPATTNGGTHRVARTAERMGLVYASPHRTG
jgi:hypothetical protein